MKKHEEHHHHNLKLNFALYLLGLLIYLITLFVPNIPTNVTIPMYFITLFLSGFHVVGEGLLSTVTESIKHKRFRPNVHLLMALGAVGAIIIGDYNEAIILILIFAGAHFLEDFAEDKSSQAIEKLLKLNVSEARLLQKDGSTKIISASDLKIGDKVLILEGDEIPSDGIITEGSSSINEAMITGESIPKDKTVGDQVFGSTINGQSTLIVEINRSSDETVLAKIIKLVSETKNDLSKTAVLIKKIEPIYVTIIILLAPIFYLIMNNFVGSSDALYRTMVFLIATSPCALAVADIPASLSAISNLAKNGVLFKGSSYLENLASLNVIAFDKTGTLTTGEPKVTNFHLFEENNLYVDLIVAMEQNSNHPLAKAVLDNFEPINNLKLEVKNVTGIGLETTYENINYLLGKPLSHKSISKEINELVSNYENDGKTVVLLSNDKNVLALIAFLDVASPYTKEAIEYFNNSNIETVMITGDANKTALKIANDINIKTVHSNVLPNDKSSIISKYKEDGKTVLYVGDGINDAPALAVSSVGIAMGNGTDIAIEVADGVLMDRDLNKIAYTYQVSKKLRSIIIQNILFSLFVILFLVTVNILGLMDMSIAVIMHEGSTLVVILNGLRMLIPIKKR